MKLSIITKELGLTLNGKDKEISALNNLQEATNMQLSFLDNLKYKDNLSLTKAAAVFIDPKYLNLVPDNTVALITKEPYLMLALVSKLFFLPPLEKEGKDPIIGENSFIAANVYIGFGTKIGNYVTIMPGAFIGDNVCIGDNSLIYPSVIVYRDCSIGKDCIIHAGTVIGSDGFGFAHTKTGEHVKIYQNGNVVIEDNIEIGSNCSVDRAVFGSTLIKKGTKIDNLVQIGHNVKIEESVIIAAQCGTSGSTTIGHHSVFAGQCGISGHIEVAPMTTCAGKTGLISSVKEPGKTFAGFPHMPHRQWLKVNAKMRALIK